jgi:glutathione S-transferase
VQGVHQVAARRAGGGSTVPVLVAPEGVLGESEAILRYADARLDEPLRLFPADPALRGEVEAFSRTLDAGLGPEGRRWIYAQLLPHRELLFTFNNQGVPAWEARALRALWPLVVRWAERILELRPTTIADDEPRVWSAFDEVAGRLADGRPHLCGERFTAADLTFACLAAPVVVPPEYGVRLPQPDELPPALGERLRAFREHPAGAYALALFRERRRVTVGGATGPR